MRIRQISTLLPKNVYTTEELMDTFPCKLPMGVKENILNLGVSKRSFVDQNLPNSNSAKILTETDMIDLCADVSKAVIRKTRISLGEIGYFVAAYDANPILSPGLSQLLVRKIGFDPYIKHVNAQGVASIAFPKALQLAEDHLIGHPEDNVLVVVSGVSSYWFQNQAHGLDKVCEIGQLTKIGDRNRRQRELTKWIATMEYFLFGDGVAAVVVGNSKEGIAVLKNAEITNIEEEDSLAGYTRLVASQEPFTFGLHSHLDKKIPDLGVKYTDLVLKRLLGNDIRSKMETCRKWAVHTGSQKILDVLAEHHNIGEEKLKESHEILKEHGNLSGASLPFILERIVSNRRLSQGDNVLMLGYGWGFSAAACLLEV